jgi:hypothetical protein
MPKSSDITRSILCANFGRAAGEQDRQAGASMQQGAIAQSGQGQAADILTAELDRLIAVAADDHDDIGLFGRLL